MKLEQLAVLLKKDSAELGTALKVQDGAELEFEPVVKFLITQNKENEAAVKSQLKDDLETEMRGKITRQVKSGVEKILKKELGVEGENLDDILAKVPDAVIAIKSKETLAITSDEIKTLKAKNLELQQQVDSRVELDRKATEAKSIESKLSKVLDKYDFKSQDLKDLALEKFIAANKFTINDSDIFLIKDGKPVLDFDEVFESHVTKYAPQKSETPGLPPKRDR